MYWFCAGGYGWDFPEEIPVRSGSGDGLSELVMDFPTVLRLFLIYFLPETWGRAPTGW